MSEKFANGIFNEMNTSMTENGATGYKTTRNLLVDLNFQVPSLRGMNENDIGLKFISAYYENEDLALRWLFYLGDVREGLGERYSFRAIIKYLANNKIEIARKIYKLIPEYSRWDNIFVFIGTDLENEVLDYVKSQLTSDVDMMVHNKACSLLAKWMPSINTSSNSTRILANKIIKQWGWTPKSYRKTLSALRKYLDVIEVKLCKNEWSAVNYETVPSKANIKYKDAFLNHDRTRRNEYLAKLSQGEVKINTSVLYPHDIVSKYHSYTTDSSLELLWKNLPNAISGNENESVFVVQDGSGSMGCRIPNSNVFAIDVSRALAIYTAERLHGPFHNMIMAFGSNPVIMQLDDKMSLREKIKVVAKNNDCGSTNIAKVFEKILDTAISTNCSQEELPKNILIVSDMEFDDGCYLSDKDEEEYYYSCRNRNSSDDIPLFKKISEKFELAGYKIPRLIFWNLNSRTNTIPVIENDLGFVLVSGYSTSNLKMVLSGEADSFKCLKMMLETPRYDKVIEAIRS